MVEMSEVSDILRHATRKSLLILDDGRVAISSMTANVIIKRADKDLAGELED